MSGEAADPIKSERRRRGPGHDNAIVKAFSGTYRGGKGPSCQSIRHPVSLRLSVKRGIVTCLDAAGWVRIRD